MKLALPVKGQANRLRTSDANTGAIVKTKNPTPLGRRKNKAVRASPALVPGASSRPSGPAVEAASGTTVADMFSFVSLANSTWSGSEPGRRYSRPGAAATGGMQRCLAALRQPVSPGWPARRPAPLGG